MHKPTNAANFYIRSGTSKEQKGSKNAIFNRYKNSVLYVDHLLNKLVGALEASGRLENTIVVITGEHGEEFWDKGRFGHTFGLNNEKIKVPAFVYFPDMPEVKRAITSHQDFFPSIFEYM